MRAHNFLFQIAPPENNSTNGVRGHSISSKTGFVTHYNLPDEWETAPGVRHEKFEGYDLYTGEIGPLDTITFILSKARAPGAPTPPTYIVEKPYNWGQGPTRDNDQGFDPDAPGTLRESDGTYYYDSTAYGDHLYYNKYPEPAYEIRYGISVQVASFREDHPELAPVEAFGHALNPHLAYDSMLSDDPRDYLKNPKYFYVGKENANPYRSANYVYTENYNCTYLGPEATNIVDDGGQWDTQVHSMSMVSPSHATCWASEVPFFMNQYAETASSHGGEITLMTGAPDINVDDEGNTDYTIRGLESDEGYDLRYFAQTAEAYDYETNEFTTAYGAIELERLKNCFYLPYDGRKWNNPTSAAAGAHDSSPEAKRNFKSSGKLRISITPHAVPIFNHQAGCVGAFKTGQIAADITDQYTGEIAEITADNASELDKVYLLSGLGHFYNKFDQLTLLPWLVPQSLTGVGNYPNLKDILYYGPTGGQVASSSEADGGFSNHPQEGHPGQTETFYTLGDEFDAFAYERYFTLKMLFNNNFVVHPNLSQLHYFRDIQNVAWLETNGQTDRYVYEFDVTAGAERVDTSQAVSLDNLKNYLADAPFVGDTSNSPNLRINDQIEDNRFLPNRNISFGSSKLRSHLSFSKTLSNSVTSVADNTTIGNLATDSAGGISADDFRGQYIYKDASNRFDKGYNSEDSAYYDHIHFNPNTVSHTSDQANFDDIMYDFQKPRIHAPAADIDAKDPTIINQSNGFLSRHELYPYEHEFFYDRILPIIPGSYPAVRSGLHKPNPVHLTRGCASFFTIDPGSGYMTVDREGGNSLATASNNYGLPAGYNRSNTKYHGFICQEGSEWLYSDAGTNNEVTGNYGRSLPTYQPEFYKPKIGIYSDEYTEFSGYSDRTGQTHLYANMLLNNPDPNLNWFGRWHQQFMAVYNRSDRDNNGGYYYDNLGFFTAYQTGTPGNTADPDDYPDGVFSVPTGSYSTIEVPPHTEFEWQKSHRQNPDTSGFKAPEIYALYWAPITPSLIGDGFHEWPSLTLMVEGFWAKNDFKQLTIANGTGEHQQHTYRTDWKCDHHIIQPGAYYQSQDERAEDDRSNVLNQSYPKAPITVWRWGYQSKIEIKSGWSQPSRDYNNSGILTSSNQPFKHPLFSKRPNYQHNGDPRRLQKLFNDPGTWAPITSNQYDAGSSNGGFGDGDGLGGEWEGVNDKLKVNPFLFNRTLQDGDMSRIQNKVVVTMYQKEDPFYGIASSFADQQINGFDGSLESANDYRIGNKPQNHPKSTLATGIDLNTHGWTWPDGGQPRLSAEPKSKLFKFPSAKEASRLSGRQWICGNFAYALEDKSLGDDELMSDYNSPIAYNFQSQGPEITSGLFYADEPTGSTWPSGNAMTNGIHIRHNGYYVDTSNALTIDNGGSVTKLNSGSDLKLESFSSGNRNSIEVLTGEGNTYQIKANDATGLQISDPFTGQVPTLNNGWDYGSSTDGWKSGDHKMLYRAMTPDANFEDRSKWSVFEFQNRSDGNGYTAHSMDDTTFYYNYIDYSGSYSSSPPYANRIKLNNDNPALATEIRINYDNMDSTGQPINSNVNNFGEDYIRSTAYWENNPAGSSYIKIAKFDDPDVHVLYEITGWQPFYSQSVDLDIEVVSASNINDSIVGGNLPTADPGDDPGLTITFIPPQVATFPDVNNAPFDGDNPNAVYHDQGLNVGDISDADMSAMTLNYNYYNLSSGEEEHASSVGTMNLKFDDSRVGVQLGGSGSWTTEIAWSDRDPSTYPTDPTVQNRTIPKPAFLPEGQFSLEIYGTITPPVSGEYYFISNSDDSSDIFVDDVRVWDWYGGHGMHTPTPSAEVGGEEEAIAERGNVNSITLEAGKSYTFKARMQENYGGDGQVVFWKVYNQTIEGNAAISQSWDGYEEYYDLRHYTVIPPSAFTKGGKMSNELSRANTAVSNYDDPSTNQSHSTATAIALNSESFKLYEAEMRDYDRAGDRRSIANPDGLPESPGSICLRLTMDSVSDDWKFGIVNMAFFDHPSQYGADQFATVDGVWQPVSYRDDAISFTGHNLTMKVGQELALFTRSLTSTYVETDPAYSHLTPTANTVLATISKITYVYGTPEPYIAVFFDDVKVLNPSSSFGMKTALDGIFDDSRSLTNPGGSVILIGHATGTPAQALNVTAAEDFGIPSPAPSSDIIPFVPSWKELGTRMPEYMIEGSVFLHDPGEDVGFPINGDVKLGVAVFSKSDGDPDTNIESSTGLQWYYPLNNKTTQHLQTNKWYHFSFPFFGSSDTNTSLPTLDPSGNYIGADAENSVPWYASSAAAALVLNRSGNRGKAYAQNVRIRKLHGNSNASFSGIGAMQSANVNPTKVYAVKKLSHQTRENDNPGIYDPMIPAGWLTGMMYDFRPGRERKLKNDIAWSDRRNNNEIIEFDGTPEIFRSRARVWRTSAANDQTFYYRDYNSARDGEAYGKPWINKAGTNPTGFTSSYTDESGLPSHSENEVMWHVADGQQLPGMIFTETRYKGKKIKLTEDADILQSPYYSLDDDGGQWLIDAMRNSSDLSAMRDSISATLEGYGASQANTLALTSPISHETSPIGEFGAIRDGSTGSNEQTEFMDSYYTSLKPLPGLNNKASFQLTTGLIDNKKHATDNIEYIQNAKENTIDQEPWLQSFDWGGNLLLPSLYDKRSQPDSLTDAIHIDRRSGSSTAVEDNLFSILTDPIYSYATIKNAARDTGPNNVHRASLDTARVFQKKSYTADSWTEKSRYEARYAQLARYLTDTDDKSGVTHNYDQQTRRIQITSGFNEIPSSLYPFATEETPDQTNGMHYNLMRKVRLKTKVGRRLTISFRIWNRLIKGRATTEYGVNSRILRSPNATTEEYRRTGAWYLKFRKDGDATYRPNTFIRDIKAKTTTSGTTTYKVSGVYDNTSTSAANHTGYIESHISPSRFSSDEPWEYKIVQHHSELNGEMNEPYRAKEGWYQCSILLDVTQEMLGSSVDLSFHVGALPEEIAAAVPHSVTALDQNVDTASSLVQGVTIEISENEMETD